MSPSTLPGPAATSSAGTSTLLSDLIEALWLVAGAAMLAFTAFLAVLVVAGVGFRLGRPKRRRNPVTVFSLSSLLVVTGTTVIFAYDYVRGSGDPTSPTPGDPAPVPAAAPRSPTIYPAVADLPLRYALGGSSGTGVTASKTRALVLYGTGGPEATTAELSATKLVNLISHFGGWTAHPVGAYRRGELSRYDAVFYLGTPGGATLPAAFLDDVLDTRRPVMWLRDGIGQLEAHDPARWARRYGFTPQGADAGPFPRMEYRGTTLPMNQVDQAGLMPVTITAPGRATVLGHAVRPDGTSVPWAVRSGNLIHVSENPLPYIAEDSDRYLALADLLFDALAPRTARRHRALVRLEDVGPAADPVRLRAVVDHLSGQGVPFSIAVYPVYRDPVDPAGKDVTIRLSERPAVVAVLRHALAHGGTVLMHGYTHQYARSANPATGRSGEDAEFYRCHLDGQQRCRPDGPVAEDSPEWALGRIDEGLREFRKAGLPAPSMFEFPHYIASPVDYVAAGRRFAQRYERALYFPGLLSGRAVADAGRGWQFFPYAVRDVYGAVVVPENLGYVTGAADSAATLLSRARANLVVRDGVASFFYHPFLGVGELPRLVSGLREMGYTFVSAGDLVAAP
ncbi:DUF2334 domain-containing protein [Jidongwangia harbinensis]|uniref:DUF2334 domain-containing protein n=1 Tax=Jidongwangia harbinensis TaxID=2878561 RepID=UPI001CDA1C25|nr:polysaccharide deacetylase family protein [Jidongwangia harbinensis]MCA2219277.1 polysaccharide deacetylase family protein [Jidongwangia harbinensis]